MYTIKDVRDRKAVRMIRLRCLCTVFSPILEMEVEIRSPCISGVSLKV